jgi:hypothetical protein
MIGTVPALVLGMKTIKGIRFFRGDETRQVDSSGPIPTKADPEKWYYEPADYEGDVLWSQGYGCYADAYHAAGCSTE